MARMNAQAAENQVKIKFIVYKIFITMRYHAESNQEEPIDSQAGNKKSNYKDLQEIYITLMSKFRSEAQKL